MTSITIDTHDDGDTRPSWWKRFGPKTEEVLTLLSRMPRMYAPFCGPIPPSITRY